MSFFWLSPSHRHHLDCNACGFTLHLLSIIGTLKLPFVLSLSSCSSSSSLHRDLSLAKESGLGSRITLHSNTATGSKVGGRVRAIRSFPRHHQPSDNRNPVDPRNGDQDQASSDSRPCSNPSEDCCSRPSGRPGLQGTEIRALEGDTFRSRPDPRFRHVDSVSKGIKTASGLVNGLKDVTGVVQKFGAPIGDLCVGVGAASGIVVGLKASKFIMKGLQASKGIFSTLQARNMVPKGVAMIGYKEKLTFLVKGFKAFYGAFTILHFANGVATQRELVKLLNWNSFLNGYKLSKSVVSVLDMILGFKFGIISSVGKGFFVMKGATDGVGVMVKAAFLSKEIYKVMLKGLGFSRENLAAFKAISEESHERYSDARSHSNILNRILYIPAIGRSFDILLTVARPASYCSDLTEQSSSSIFLLVDSLSEAHANLHTCYRKESGYSYIFSLAIPLPSNGQSIFLF